MKIPGTHYYGIRCPVRFNVSTPCLKVYHTCWTISLWVWYIFINPIRIHVLLNHLYDNYPVKRVKEVFVESLLSGDHRINTGVEPFGWIPQVEIPHPRIPVDGCTYNTDCVNPHKKPGISPLKRVWWHFCSVSYFQQRPLDFNSKVEHTKNVRHFRCPRFNTRWLYFNIPGLT